MWTIIKSVLRFFKSSKLSMIGLFLLIFFSSSIFTLLNSTTTNLQNSYNNISLNGNLHDFVINEHYSLGYADYDAYYDNENNKPRTDGSGKYYVTYNFTPTGTLTLNQTTNKYEIDLTKIGWTNSYLNVFNAYKNIDEYKNNFVFFSKEFEVDEQIYNDALANKPIEDLPEEVTTFLNNKKVELSNITNTNISKVYDDILTGEKTSQGSLNLPIEYRRFRSLNVNNTQQKIFFKVVESDIDYTIDKIVYYSGNQLSKNVNYYSLIFDGLSESMLKGSTQEDKDLIKDRSRLMVDYLAKSKWPDTNISNSFINFDSYVKSSDNFNPYFDEVTDYNGQITPTVIGQLKSTQDKVRNFIDSVLDSNYSGKYEVVNKLYQIRFAYEEASIPKAGYLDDFTSYEMVISPYYAQKLNKKPISIEEWTDHQGDSQEEFRQFIRGLPDENKIEIDAIEYVVKATGVSPDFMYPILTFESLVPNKEKEQVVYANTNGYEKIYDAFRGNDTENFIVGKFDNQNLSQTSKQNILNQINQVSAKYMSWPANIDAAYFYDDSNNTLTPTALRVQFVPQVVQTTNIVSVFMTSFVLVLSVFVSIIIIRRFIETNRNSLGIMQASGYKKREIVTALNIFICIPTILSSICGYIVGFLLQSAAIGILGNFWTIPTSFAAFSVLYLLVVVLGLSVLFICVSTFFSWLSLRGETSEFMKDDAKYKMSRLSRIMKFPFSKFNIIIRFRAAVAFSSMWRLFVLSIMSALLMLSLTFSFAVLNKYDAAASASFAPRNYIYSMNLITPTVQGGQYYAVPYSSQGMTLKANTYFNIAPYSQEDINKNKSDYIAPWYQDSSYSAAANDPNIKKFMDIYGNYQLVSMNDSSEIKNNINYTKNKTSTKMFIDHNVGLASLSTNPWTLAESMMPPNNSNYANNTFKQMLNKAYNDTTNTLDIILPESEGSTTLVKQNATYSKALKYFTKESDGNSSSSFPDGTYSTITGDDGELVEEPNYRELDSSKTVNLAVLNSNFLTFLYDLYSNQDYKEYAYSINYNKLVINETDEPFSYMNFNISKINDKEVNIIDDLTANGISRNSYRLDIRNTNNEYLNPLLEQEGFYPIIINEFASRKYGLTTGDVINVSVSNSADRYSRQLFGIDSEVEAQLKVVGIASTYQGSEFFMSQYDVNKILGLDINNFSAIKPTSADQISNTIQYDLKGYDSLPSKKEFIVNRSGFNGIFTTDEDSLVEVTNGVSLYSPSGLYPGTDKFSSSPTLNSVVEKNKKLIATTLGIDEIENKTTEEIINQIAQVFGESTQFTILSSATSRNALLSVFDSVTTTTSNVQTVVLAIIILVSLIIVVIISGIIINDSIKLAAILKCLGLRDSRNALTFLSVYLPVLLIGLIIAIPFSYLINNIYVNIIFNMAGILLTIPMVWWHYLLSTAVILAIFLLSYWIAWYRIHNMDLTKAIK